jgi:Prenyltransferase and squalene oxidase repeat
VRALALPVRQQDGEQVTKQEPEFLELERDSDLHRLPAHRRDKAEAISAGLEYLLVQHHNRHWSTTPGSGSDPLNTACILARLEDVLLCDSSHRLRIKVNEALDWLVEAQTPGGGWEGCTGEDEAGSTAWAIIALGKSGRAAPEAALEWLQDCRRADGGFGARPGDSAASALEITAVAAQALGHVDSDAEKFLCAQLQSGAADPAEQLAACAAILDCDKSLVPLPLLNQACQITARIQAERASDQALLLRCLLRLRLTRAWGLADGLRFKQRADGSWPGPHGNDAVSTATVASALALVESQPGLYFGSDLPRPRRLGESSQR